MTIKVTSGNNVIHAIDRMSGIGEVGEGILHDALDDV